MREHPEEGLPPGSAIIFQQHVGAELPPVHAAIGIGINAGEQPAGRLDCQIAMHRDWEALGSQPQCL